MNKIRGCVWGRDLLVIAKRYEELIHASLRRSGEPSRLRESGWISSPRQLMSQITTPHTQPLTLIHYSHSLFSLKYLLNTGR